MLCGIGCLGSVPSWLRLFAHCYTGLLNLEPTQIAFVILHQDAAVNEEDIRDYCRGKISRFKIPKYVFFVDSYPMTSSGKIKKNVLRETGNKKVGELGIST